MLEITDTNKFGKMVADALAKVELTVKDAQTKKRWINAIAKAVVEIESNGAFMTYDKDENHLVIWSQKSNEIYSANGVCQCKAFEQGYACWHRAAARLVRLYLGLDENKCPKLPTKNVIEYMLSAFLFRAHFIWSACFSLMIRQIIVLLRFNFLSRF